MLFIIDMQNKFLDPESDSYVKDSEKLIPKIIEKIKEYEDKDDIIFYTLDIELVLKRVRSNLTIRLNGKIKFTLN